MTSPQGIPALGDSLSNLYVASVLKNLGLLLIDKSPEEIEELSRRGPETVAQDESSLVEGDNQVKGRKMSRKDANAELRRLRDVDSSIRRVFIHKSSLAAVSPATAGTEEVGGDEDAVIEGDRISKYYKVGDCLAAVRVIGYNLVEGWSLGSNLKSVVDRYTLTSQVQYLSGV
jgi:hypothetical protein